jgi:hypothetical protein
MGWHGMPFHFPIGVSEGAKLAVALYGTAILLVIFSVVCRLADGRSYRRPGPPWRRRSRAVPARDQDGRGMLTARERQLWDDLVVLYGTDAAATWQSAEVPHDRDQGRRLRHGRHGQSGGQRR